MHPPESLRRLALQLARDGRLQDARETMAAALAAAPEQIAWKRDMAVLRGAEGDWRGAAELYEETAAGGTGGGNDWARALIEAGDAERALEVLGENPGDARALYLRGRACSRLGRRQAAVDSLLACLERDPAFAPAHLLLAQELLRGGYYFAARDSMQAYTRLRPGDVEGQCGLVPAHWHTGDLAACRAVCEELIARGVASPLLESLYRVVRIHTFGETAASLRAVHEAWNVTARIVAAPGAGWRQIDPERKLRVGYVANQLAKGPFFHFITPLLRDRDRAAYSVYCYHSSAVEDAHGAILRGYADYWLDSKDLEEIARRIEEDRIDILVDLSGHYGGHLPLFRKRRAPIQLALPTEYPATTGVPGFDWILTDRRTCPEGHEGQYMESPYFLGDGYLTYQPPAAVEIPPRGDGPIRFGLFQRPAKWNRVVFDVLRAIVRGVPGARVMVHYAAAELDVEGSAAQQWFREELGCEVEFRGSCPLEDHLRVLAECDIALDAFPYNGQTTTCECLWMGVPVVTLAGEVHASRVGCAILSQVGLGELVAASAEEYVKKAEALAGDRQRLAQLRSALRERMRAAPMGNGVAVRGIERAYRELWRGYCERYSE